MTDVSFTACTIASCARYPETRVLARSLAAVHPEARFVTLLVDAGPEGLPPDVLSPADIGVSEAELAVLGTAYTAEQACAALLPQLLAALLARGGPVLHLGATALVLDDVAEPVLAALADASLVVVPRTLRPLPDDDLRPSPADLHAAGVYETGVLAVAEGAEYFLREWADAALRDPDGTFLDGAPALVEHRLIRDPGVGLSYWNAAQRPLSGTGGAMTACGTPLRTVHFDGFDADLPWLYAASLTRPRVLLSEHPVLAELCTTYRAGLAVPVTAPPRVRTFGALPDGTELPRSLRVALRTEWFAAGIADVDRWLAERWPAALWQDSPDLQDRFPDPSDAEFRRWCATDGVAQGRLPLAAVADRGTAEPAELRDELGVCVLGDGPVADALRAAVAASGLPHTAAPSYPVVLCAGAPPELPDRYLVAVRTDEPDEPVDADEVWTSADLVLPVPDPGERDEHARRAARERWGVGDETVFVALLDHAAAADTGGVELVRAFDDAFADRADTRLVVFGAPAAEPGSAERLRLATSGDPRIRLVDGPLDADGALAADWLVCWQRAGTAGSGALRFALASAAASGVPVITRRDGVAAELFDVDSAVLAEPAGLAETFYELAYDRGAAGKLGTAARDRVLAAFGPAAAGAVLRGRVERAYRTWRARGTVPDQLPEHDPLQPLRAARHALLRQPDVGVGHKIPMAPALRKAVLRVLNHYDAHLRTVLSTLLDGVERSTTELLATQQVPPDLDALRAELADDLAERDDTVLRLRADLAGHGRAVTGLSAAVADEAAARQTDTAGLGDRIEALTAALRASTERIDELEAGVARRFAERDSRDGAGVRSATQALQATDALRRVVVRAHERSAELDGDLAELAAPTALVLCDAGLVRLPAEDSVMLPVLSSNGAWEPGIGELIDSLIEPDGVFLDVGAYVGYHCLRVLSRLGSSGAVVAVEPDPVAADLVQHNVSANVSGAVADRLAVVRAAAWDSEVPLTVRPAPGGGLLVDGVADTTSSGESAEPVPRAVRLDRELESSGAMRGLPLTVVKVDVPGCAHRALGGLVRLLRRDRPNVLCTMAGPLTRELGGGEPDAPDAVLAEFGRLGYDLLPLGASVPLAAAEVAAAVTAGEVSTVWLRPRTGR